MKTLGSKQVIRETFVDGRKIKKWRETRVVYRKADGTYWVNDGGSKSRVELIDGKFHWSTNISSLRMEKVIGPKLRKWLRYET